MTLLFKLLLANIRLRPARTILTALAVVASSCVVVWVVSGYDALLAQSIDENAAKALGRFDLVISNEVGGPTSPGRGRPRSGESPSQKRPARKAEGSRANSDRDQPGRPERGGRRSGLTDSGSRASLPGLPRRLVDHLKADPHVAEVSVVAQSRVSTARAVTDPNAPALSKLLRGDRPPVYGAPPLGPPLLGTDALEPPYPLVSGRWIDPNHGDRLEAVLSADYAATLGVKEGDDVTVNSEVGEWLLRLVGIVEQTTAGGQGRRGGGGSQAGLFVTLPLAETINGYANHISRISLVLHEDADPSAFRDTLTTRLASLSVRASITDIQAMRETLARGLSQSGSRTLAYSATTIALMAALFIIFTTLSMGVSEKARELAVLRAVGLTRGQVASLVILEGLLLALLGWAGGLAAGWGLIATVALAKPDLFTDGATLGPWCVGLTGLAALGGALAASIQPAWRATRVTPLDALVPPRAIAPSRWIGLASAGGLILLMVNPLLTYVLPLADSTRTWGYALAGYPAMVLGFVLLAPCTIVAVETVAGPWIARGLSLPPRLLASILSANLWRTLGTTVALTVGLGLYLATQIWGYSMLGPFTPGDWVPEMLVGFEPTGIPDDQLDAVKQVKGVLPQHVLPLAVDQPRLVKDMTGGEGFSITRQDNVVLVGLDPQLAFGGDDPMIDASFSVGNRSTALRKLLEGGACLVPDHFLASAGLKVGDRLGMIPPGGSPDRAVSYEVVGALSLPGWHWMTKMSGLRRQTTRTGALVFAPITDVRHDFAIERTNFVWLDTDGRVKPEQVETAMQAIAETHGESRFRVAGVGEVTSRRPYARLTATETVRTGIRERADGIIWGMSQIPLVTLLISSLAVVNTVVSSVRARRWDLGVLRALGTTRGGLVRLILAESLLIGLAVCVLGVGFGLMAGWCGTGMARYLSPFGGMSTPLILPWKPLAIGLSSALGLCLLAALGPALSTGRTEPLKLLQAGRGAG